MPLDYEILRIIWWVLLGVLLIGFAVMDGFDLGIGMLLPVVGKTDMERRIIINTVAPTWEGNQVWFILGGGAIFAAWPALYAVSFSGFYFAMFLVLCALILRPVGFKYRSKITHPVWRSTWDYSLFIGGFVPALIFGVALGNVIQGVPFYFDNELRSFYTGSFWELLNPFALMCGVVSVVMLVMHGATFLAVKSTAVIHQRAVAIARAGALLLIGLFAVAGLWLVLSIDGYAITSSVVTDGPSNPLRKEVAVQAGAWLSNYQAYPWTILAPALGFLGALLVILSASRGASKMAFLSSSMSVIGVITTVGVTMFPFILPSSTHPAHSLLVWDASSSHLTLTIMLFATVLFMPIILLYTAWVYRVLRGKITEEYVKSSDAAY